MTEDAPALGNLSQDDLEEYLKRLVQREVEQFDKVESLIPLLSKSPEDFHYFMENALLMVEVLEHKMYIIEAIPSKYPSMYPDDYIQMVVVDTNLKLAQLKDSIIQFQQVAPQIVFTEKKEVKKNGRHRY